MSLPHILVIFTGGTISMTFDKESGGAQPSLSGGQILDKMHEIRPLAELEVREYGQYPGPHMTPAMMMEVARLAQAAAEREDLDGVIVTHGTDTLEETAYLLDLVVSTDKPILVIGSMRHSDAPDWDGPENMRDAVMTIASRQFRGLGVLTCLNGEINAASEVTKTHTQQHDTFKSFDFGPIGRIFEGRPIFLRKPYIHERIGFADPVEPVHIIKCYSGMDGVPFRALIDRHVRGLVVEALGTGNVPPLAYDGICDLIDAGIPVVLVSRCPWGPADDEYSYYGAGRNLKKKGVIFAKYLNGQKARIKLMLALAVTSSREELGGMFEYA